MLVNLITAILFVVFVTLVCKALFGKKIDFSMPERPVYKMQLDARMKWAALFLLFLLVAMLVPNVLPAGNPFKAVFGTKLGIVGTLLLLTVFMALVRPAGTPILDIPEGVSKVPWSLILLVSSALAISGYITADGTGIIRSRAECWCKERFDLRAKTART